MAVNVETMEVVQGEVAEYSVSVRDSAGQAIAYGGYEPLTLLVWAGDDQAPLLLGDSSASWQDAPSGLIRLHFGAADTARWSPGTYAVRIRLLDGPDVVGVYAGRLDVGTQPGSGVAGKVYCSFDDMRLYAPWIGRLQEPSDRAGFAEQRERARSWLDDSILNSYRPDWGWYGRTKDDSSFGGTRWGYGLDGDVPPLKWLRDQLDSDYMIVRDWAREATARFAVAMVCESLIGEERSTSYQGLALQHRAMADALLASRVVEIDLPDSNGVRNGFPDIWIRIGLKSSR